jgi:4-amino-4-deoxy-L-arabinose transferase-like glycosyltransferase
VIRALRRDQPRWWLAAGAIVGVGMYNKLLIGLLLIGLAGGLLLAGPRRTLLSGSVWAGVAVAVVIGSPNIWYQISHDWPQFAMAEALRKDKGDDARVMFVPLQVLMLGPPLVPFWVAGIVSLWRDRRLRAIAVAYPLICALLLVIAGQPYYTMGLLLVLYAAGSVAAVRWLAGRPGRRAWVVAALVVNMAVSAVISLPILGVSTLAKTPIPAINQVVRDQIGWPAYVRQVAEAYRALPAGQRAVAVIVAGNYGDAGAVDRYGGRYGLPHTYSGLNELYHRGRPPESASTVIAIGYDPDTPLTALFTSCDIVGHFDNEVDIDNEEQGRPIYVCHGPHGTWRELWPRLRRYG